MLRINETLSFIPNPDRRKLKLREITSLLLVPSKDLREIASAHADDLPRSIRILMKTVGAWRHDGRLESYLMFEPKYISELINLGYRDTIERADEVINFLS